jgi:hypothetical protein
MQGTAARHHLGTHAGLTIMGAIVIEARAVNEILVASVEVRAPQASPEVAGVPGGHGDGSGGFGPRHGQRARLRGSLPYDHGRSAEPLHPDGSALKFSGSETSPHSDRPDARVGRGLVFSGQQRTGEVDRSGRKTVVHFPYFQTDGTLPSRGHDAEILTPDVRAGSRRGRCRLGVRLLRN